MSYVLTAYLVDIDKLKSVIGSKDASIVDSIVSKNPEQFELDDEEDEDEEDELTLFAALWQLIMD